MFKFIALFVISFLLLLRATVSFSAEEPPQTYKIMVKAKSDYNERVREEWLKGNKITPELRNQIKQEVYKIADEQYKNEKRKESSLIRQMVKEVLSEIKDEASSLVKTKPDKEKNLANDKSDKKDKKEDKALKETSSSVVLGSAQAVTFNRHPASEKKDNTAKSSHFEVESVSSDKNKMDGAHAIEFSKPTLSE